MNEKLRAAVYGFAVGDALGVPYEFKRRDTFYCSDMVGFGTWNQPAGTWSDDTSMVLATCDSIRERGVVDPYDIMTKFVKWRYHGEYTARGEVFDVGNTTDRALMRFTHGGKVWSECGLRDEFSNGNGSLMRILPLAFVPRIDNGVVAEVSELTHAHWKSVQTCCEFVYFCQRLIDDPAYSIPDGLTRTPRDSVISTGYVVTTLRAALWSLGVSQSYPEAVLTAVNLGGDTDTIAALTGALAALKWGMEGIPKHWIDKLANKPLIESCLF